MTHVPLLVPAGGRGVYDDFPGRQGCAADALERVGPHDRRQLDEARRVDERQAGGVFELLPHVQQVLVGCCLGYLRVAPPSDVGQHLNARVLRVQAAKVALYDCVGLGHLGA